MNRMDPYGHISIGANEQRVRVLTYMIFPKSVNLLSSAFGAPFIPLRVNPPGGPIRLAPIPAGPAPPIGLFMPMPPGALIPPAIEGLVKDPGPPRLAARLNGPEAGPLSDRPPPNA
jgi:hypothetical protein